uniref:Carboxylesterase type B domain-containing protein n=1 Tax=Cyprinodon variegatus TaxID=28743 RepID=A0A3Q2CHF6_CYPVA
KDPFLRFPVNVDGHFLTVHELFQNQELITIPIMTGVNNHEGGFVVADVSSVFFFFFFFCICKGLLLDVLLAQEAAIRDLILRNYIESGEDRTRNRDGFTEFIGDYFFTIPAIKIANSHRAAVYLYEYHHAPTCLQKIRPSFVKCDHLDEIFMVLGYCFTTTHEEEFSKIMMSYWGNFARTGSPNGEGLVNWPKYGADEKYLSLDLKKQVSAQFLKKDNFLFLTKTLPEKIQKLEEKMEHSEL